MKTHAIRRYFAFPAVLSMWIIIMMAATTAYTAANTIPTSKADRLSVTTTISQLLPAACNGLNPTRLVIGASTTINGTNADELILGTSIANTIDGRGGNDCIVGGGGDDSLDGGAGTGDICIGGPGTDTYNRCESTIP